MIIKLLVVLLSNLYTITSAAMEETKAESKASIPASLWKSKFASKREQWMFLTQEVKAYLPSAPECVTTYFLKDLIQGKKKYM